MMYIVRVLVPADHSNSSNEENELLEDRLIDIPLDNCVV